ncbi:hypothetical protein FJ251_13695 [bacterium]|nr:hypothetical protein [bacterium]
MDWLARARREIPECTRGHTAVTAVGGISAVSAVRPGVPCPEAEPSFGSTGSAARAGPPDAECLREEFEERAAILEFDGGLNRAEAERLAWELVLTRHTVH